MLYKDLSKSERLHLLKTFDTLGELNGDTTHIGKQDPEEFCVQLRKNHYEFDFYHEGLNRWVEAGEDPFLKGFYEVPEDFDKKTGEVYNDGGKQWNLHFYTCGEVVLEDSFDTLEKLQKAYKEHYENMIVEHLSVLIIDEEDHQYLAEKRVNHMFVKYY